MVNVHRMQSVDHGMTCFSLRMVFHLGYVTNGAIAYPNTITTSVKIQSTCNCIHVEVIPIIKVLVDPVHYHCQK